MTGAHLPILTEINKGISKRIYEAKPRKYLGGSSIGGSCSRKIQYMMTHSDHRKPHDERVQRIFDVGNSLEDYMEKLLRDAGFELVTLKDDGKQFGFSLAEGRIQGHIDGAVLSGPDVMAYPALAEFKTANTKNFKNFAKHGLLAANENYYAQVQFYQFNMQLTKNPALWMVLDKDCQELYVELIPHHAPYAERLLAKAGDILDATDRGELMDRGYHDKTNRNCSWCDFKGICWEED
jgi:hypothetical protein